MAVIATEQTRLSNVLKAELFPEMAYCREVVTVNEGAAVDYVPGTVVGKVTTGGKYKVAVETATDGSKVFAGVVLEAKAIAATTDTKVLILKRGPASVSKGALVIDATYDNATKLGVVYTAMETAGIQLLETV